MQYIEYTAFLIKESLNNLLEYIKTKQFLWLILIRYRWKKSGTTSLKVH